jgi:hypothetical protein
MDARMNYTTQLTTDHMANLHRAADVHRLRRSARGSIVDSVSLTDHVVSVPRHSWWRVVRWHHPALPTA